MQGQAYSKLHSQEGPATHKREQSPGQAPGPSPSSAPAMESRPCAHLASTSHGHWICTGGRPLLVHASGGGPRCQASGASNGGFLATRRFEGLALSQNGGFVGYPPFAGDGCPTSVQSADSSSTLAQLGYLLTGKGSPAIRLPSAGDSWVRRGRAPHSSEGRGPK